MPGYQNIQWTYLMNIDIYSVISYDTLINFADKSVYMCMFTTVKSPSKTIKPPTKSISSNNNWFS